MLRQNGAIISSRWPGFDTEVQVTTVKHVAKAGYKIGDRVVRAAQVLVVDPADA